MADRYLEWSSTYVRVRAEMFVAALLLLACSAWTIDLEHLPLVGFKGDVPKWQLLYPLLLFFIYSLVSFVYRYRVETSRFIDHAQRVDNIIRGLNEFTSALTNADPMAKVPEFLEHLRNLETSATLNGTQDQNHFNVIMQSVEASLKRITTPADVIQSIIDRLPNQLTAILLRSPADIGKEILAPVEAGLRPNLDRMNQLADEMRGMLSDLQIGNGKFDELAATTKTELLRVRDEIVDVQARQSTALTKAVNENTETIGKVERQLRAIVTDEGVERFWLSFVVPLSASVLVTLAALLLSWRDMV